ncbi:hypothetical protein [Paenibacillus xylanilyticus]|uniref:Uncharacterized protein n=1 Tax=Paenibacillus xylanilyticus TaxID=248903 RepID=A0A7Y6BUD0_9BACL|nr:hypothetical protein [Paenibacillus xylanilyticus]NUU75193.1 hypothetical protein [Paenibacillus xylanilyticus]
MMRKYFFVLCLVFVYVSLVTGCSFLSGNTSVKEANLTGYSSSELQALLKSIADHVDYNVSGKKQRIYYESDIGKIVVQAELTDSEVEELNKQFGEELISLKPVDNEDLVGITPSQDNPFPQ